MDRDVALPPEPKGVHVGSGEAQTKEKVGKEGWSSSVGSQDKKSS